MEVEQMDETLGHELSKKEKEEIQRMCGDANAIYMYMQQENLHQKWTMDSERFMGFTALSTRDLVKHSITLSRLTTGLMVLSLALLVLGIMNFIALISA